MATASEVIQYLKNTYQDMSQDGEVFTLRLGVGDGRSQLAIINVTDSFIMASSPFAKVGQISDSQALGASSVGAPITVLGDYYVTTRVMMIKDIDPSEVQFVVEFTMASADNLEKELGLGDNI
jgi:hypothetical protein